MFMRVLFFIVFILAWQNGYQLCSLWLYKQNEKKVWNIVIEWDCFDTLIRLETGSFTVLEHKTKYFCLLVEILLFIFSKFIHSYTGFNVTIHINKYQQFIITVQSNKQ